MGERTPGRSWFRDRRCSPVVLWRERAAGGAASTGLSPILSPSGQALCELVNCNCGTRLLHELFS